MTDSDTEFNPSLKLNRFHPLSEEYSPDPNIIANNKYRRSPDVTHSSTKKKTTSTPMTHSSNTKKSLQSPNTSDSEDELPWKEMSMNELLNEYDKLHKRKQKGSADKVKQWRQKIDIRIKELEKSREQDGRERVDSDRAGDTIEKLKQTVAQKDKEIIALEKEVEKQKAELRVQEKMDEYKEENPTLHLQLTKDIEELLRRLVNEFSSMDRGQVEETVILYINYTIYYNATKT